MSRFPANIMVALIMADFVGIIKDDISSGDDSPRQGNEWIDKYELNFDNAIDLIN